jgi:hypothetical protein
VIEAYLILANRIRGEMDDLVNLIELARRAMDASEKNLKMRNFLSTQPHCICMISM